MRRHGVAWSRAARGDLLAIVEFIAIDNEQTALSVLERLQSRAQSLDLFPERGRIVQELRWHGVMGFKEILEKPWRIVYHHALDGIIVVGIFDGRRDLADVLIDRVNSM